MSTRGFTRRRLLAGAAGAAGIAGLSACGAGGNASSNASSVAAAGKAALPTFTARQGAKPDYPAGANGVRAGFKSYPYDSIVKTVDAVPGKGGTIGFQTFNFGATPVARAQNPYWQDMERRLGVTWEYQGVLADSYLAKVQTTIAGDSLPSLMTFGSSAFVVPQLPALLKAKFTDLTDYVSGDNIAKYPNLAGIATDAWRGTVYGGRIYGIPRMQATISGQWFVWADKFAAKGITKEPTTPDDLVAALKEVNDPGAGSWAITNAPTALILATGGLGLATGWSLDEATATFSPTLARPEYVEALQQAAAMQQAGLINPDGATADGNTLFAAAQGLLTLGSANAWAGTYATLDKVGSELGAWMPHLADGSIAPMGAAPAHAFFNAVSKKLSSAQVEEVLAVADYLAAPFASEEQFAVSFGVRDHTWKLTDNQPVQTAAYAKEAPLGLDYVANSALAVVNTAYPAQVALTHAYESTAAPHMVTDPATGLYSDTAGKQGGILSKLVSDWTSDIVLGRKSPADWTSTGLPAWRSQGGDAIAKELSAAWQANQ